MESVERETKMQTIQLIAARFGSFEAAFHTFKNREGVITKMNLLKGVRTYLGLAPSYGYELLQLFSTEGSISFDDWIQSLTSYVPTLPPEPILEPFPEQIAPQPPTGNDGELSEIGLDTDIDLESQADSMCSLPLREEEEVVFPQKTVRSVISPRQSVTVLEALARTTSQLRRSRQDLHKRLIGAKFHQLRLY